jgi:hypothetical protein
MPRQPAQTIKQVEQKELEVETRTTSTRSDGPTPLVDPVVEERDVPVEDRVVATSATKGLEIVMNRFNHYYVRWYGAQGGAPIPKAVAGTWTRKDNLQAQIDRYFMERDQAKAEAEQRKESTQDGAIG